MCVCVMFLYEHDNFRVSSMQKKHICSIFSQGPEGGAAPAPSWVVAGWCFPPVISWFINPMN
jgi:hypothetical protein